MSTLVELDFMPDEENVLQDWYKEIGQVVAGRYTDFFSPELTHQILSEVALKMGDKLHWP